NEAGIPAGPVYSIDQTFDDAQVQHLGVADQVEVADGSDDPPTVGVLRYPVTLSATPASVRRGPPTAGIETRAVLRDIGYDDHAIDEMIDAGAAAERVGKGWLS